MKKGFFLLMLLCVSVWMHAQTTTPPLERRVTLAIEKRPLREVLDEMEKQARCSFSYQSTLIEGSKLVSVKATNRPVREVLTKLLGPDIRFKEKKEYIILSKVPADEKKVTVGGYVQSTDGKPVKGATVYDDRTLASANTNQYGYYEIKIDRDLSTILHVSKDQYRDTIAPLKPYNSQFKNVVIADKDTTKRVINWNAMADSTQVFFHKIGQELSRDSLFAPMDSLERARHDSLWDARWEAFGDSTAARWSDFKQWIIGDSLRLRNVNDTIYRRWQTSLVPYVGTNRKMSPQCVNDFSLNLVAGFSRGNRMLEIGGIGNLVRENVSGVQIAGFGNVVGGAVHGCQLAGFANVTRGRTDGLSVAGFANYHHDDLRGADIAGFMNYYNEKATGLQLAGFGNFAMEQCTGLALAGFGNFHSDGYRGMQLAGFGNFCESTMDGLQLSGFINVAEHVRGAQIGIINIADTLDGVSIGLFPWVKKGYHAFEVFTTDVSTYNIGFRTGVRPFYMIYTAGLKKDFGTDALDHLNAGMGIGSAPRLAKKLFVPIELTAHYMQSFATVTSNAELLKYRVHSYDGQLYVGLDWAIAKHFGISAGPVLHCWVGESKINFIDLREQPSSNYVRTDTWGDYTARFFVGYRVALHF